MTAKTDLAPCPFCGSSGVEDDSGEDSVRIRCRACGARGPAVYFLDSEVESGDYSQAESEVRDRWNIRAAIAEAKP